MNYYKILGLSTNNVTETEIKKSYKKMAMKWHPDKWMTKTQQEKDKTENKFKEITKAYEILINKDKRIVYDLHGENGLNHNSNLHYRQQQKSPFIFKYNINGRQFKFNQPKSNMNIHMRNINKITKNINIYCTLEELYYGCVKNMVISEQYTNPKTNITSQLNEKIEIVIKKSPGDNSKIITHINQTQYIFTIKQKPHKYYKRIGNDIVWECKLTNAQIEKGVKINVPLINKEYIDFLSKDEVLYNGKMKIIENKGMFIKKTNTYGNFIIKFILL